MTNKRDELIEEAAKAIGAKSWLGFAEGELFADAYARIAFEVFEQSHTPCEASSNDEREALARVLFIASDDFAFADRMAKAWDAPGTHGRARWYNYADKVLAAGFRRVGQGEPTPCLVEHPFSGRLCSNPAASCDGHVCDITPAVQGEPTDAQVKASTRAFYAASWLDIDAGRSDGRTDNQRSEDGVRAALRAAFATEQGENRPDLRRVISEALRETYSWSDSTQAVFDAVTAWLAVQGEPTDALVDEVTVAICVALRHTGDRECEHDHAAARAALRAASATEQGRVK